MANAALSSASSVELPPRTLELVERSKSSRLIRRRPTLAQGRALEVLGHAVEYLVDSRMYLPAERCDDLAVQTLMRLNREVFAECAVVVPLGRRMRRWVGW